MRRFYDPVPSMSLTEVELCMVELRATLERICSALARQGFNVSLDADNAPDAIVDAIATLGARQEGARAHGITTRDPTASENAFQGGNG